MMNYKEQILEVDGSCRDINFPIVNESSAIRLVEYFQQNCKLISATNSVGDDLAVEWRGRNYSSFNGENLFSVWKCEGIISQLQIAMFQEELSGFYIEITFFPNDITIEIFEMQLFLMWLGQILGALSVSEYYVRYENASWKFGDTSEYSGVIFTHNEFPLNG